MEPPGYPGRFNEYFETFAKYSPDRKDFCDFVAGVIPDTWQLKRSSDLWYHCTPKENHLPRQGWKIHLSSTPAGAKALLESVVSPLIDTGTSFKFGLDRFVLYMMNSKSWPRAGSGKFITAYPKDVATCRELLDVLHSRTSDMRGPFILSDRPYRESRVLFYRYGLFRRDTGAGIDGQDDLSLTAPNGSKVPDGRLPYFAPPEWVRDPFDAARADKTEEKSDVSSEQPDEVTLKNGSYRVTEALALRASGGVYLAEETETGRAVVIKEARPDICLAPDGTDAVTVLRKEYRLLQRVASEKLAPEPLELFQDWDHWFLAEELIEGRTLSAFTAGESPILRHSPTPEDFRSFYSTFQVVFSQLLDHVETMRRFGIALVDLSLTNVMIQPETRCVKLIDFDAACQLGVDPPLRIVTPGFAPLSRTRPSWQPSHEEDLFGLGAVMLAFLVRVNPMLGINPRAPERFLDAMVSEDHLPQIVKTMVLSLLSEDDKKRPTVSTVRNMLCEMLSSGPTPPKTGAQRENDSRAAGRMTAESALRYIESTADYERADRLFPADPRVFQTNPLSIAYGACGVAYAFHRVRGQVPTPVLEWMLKQPIEPRRYPPGLHVGLAGVAWTMDEIGLRDLGETLLRKTHDDERVNESPDLYLGQAGWGLANLRFFRSTANEEYLDTAILAAKRLMANSQDDAASAGLYWPTVGPQQLGLGHGSSGIALFFLYLYLTTRDESFLDIGRKALDYDLFSAVPTKDDGLSWPRFRGEDYVVYPYWRFGSAGIGSVVARYYAVLEEARLLSILDKILIDTERKYSAFCSLTTGLAGLGHFLLDMHFFFRRLRCLRAAERIVAGIDLFSIEKPRGVAFPGEGGMRISCDYATGSAGVAVFLDRVSRPEEGAPFRLDELIQRSAAGVQDVH